MSNYKSMEEMVESISKAIPSMQVLDALRGQVVSAIMSDAKNGKIQDKMIAAAKAHAVVDLAELGFSVMSEMIGDDTDA